jgi:dTDP-L-rhamnose 4-epimerase
LLLRLTRIDVGSGLKQSICEALRMTKRVLITGGAGFIGSHLADELLRHGYEVRVLDSLSRQVHPTGDRPGYLHRDVELCVGDVRDRDAVERALKGVNAVYHFAAMVGVGQSMSSAKACTRLPSTPT